MTTPTFAPVVNSLKRFEWQTNIIYIGFIAVFILFAITLGDSGFTSPNNLLNIFRQVATISIMAVAMTFVIAAAEIDLSIGSIAGLASVVTAITLNSFGLILTLTSSIMQSL
jgi:ribose transport system permease protein